MLLLFKSLGVMLIILVIIYIYNKIKRKNNSTTVEAFSYTEPN